MTNRHRSSLRATALMGIAAAALTPQLAYAQEAPVALHIATQDLSTALTDFARQSRQQLLFSPELVRGKRAGLVRGSYTPERGLSLLLAGTGLRHRTTPSGAFLLVQAGAQATTSPVPGPTTQADDAPSSDPELDEGDEIVVIGTAGAGIRRQDAAFAVTTLDEDAIGRIAPASTADLFRVIPGVSAESSGGQNGANIFVRGFPSGGDAQFVTLELEGVPFFPPPTLSFLENTQLIRVDETLQRIEAVRGGTGALFSSGQPGLTVNFVQKKGGSVLGGLGKISATDYGEIRGDAVVSGPLGPDTSFMVGGYYAQGNGIRDPQFTAEKGGQITANVEHDFGRGSILAYGRYLDDRGQWLLPIPVIQDGEDISEFPGFDAGSGALAGPETRFSTFNTGETVDLAEGRGAEIVNFGLNFDYELADGVTIRNGTSYLSGDADTVGLVPAGAPQTATAFATGLSGTIGNLTFVNGGGAVSGDQQVIVAGTWEVRKQIESFVNDLAIEFESGNNTLTGGVYYATYSSADQWSLGNNQLLTAEPNARRLDLVLADGRAVTRDGFVGGSFFNVNATYDGTDIAGYLVDELQITPQLRIDGGVRWQRHEVDGRLENNTFGVDTDSNPNTLYNNGDAVLNGTFSTLRYRDDKFSWTAGANYDFTSDVGAFLRYSRGHTFPFFDNLRDGLDQIQKVDSYEAGLKVSTDLLRVYATLFRNDFSGLATTQIVEGEDEPVAAIGGARTTGLELEGALRPIDNFSIGFSGTWLNAEYVDFFSNNGAIDNSGNQVQRQPEWTWRIAPLYEIPVGADSMVALFTSLTYVGDRFSDVENQQLLPSFYKWDAGINFDINDRISLQVTGDNLTDEIGLTEGNPRVIGAQGAGVILARPILGRSFRFSASYRF